MNVLIFSSDCSSKIENAGRIEEIHRKRAKRSSRKRSLDSDEDYDETLIKHRRDNSENDDFENNDHINATSRNQFHSTSSPGHNNLYGDCDINIILSKLYEAKNNLNAAIAPLFEREMIFLCSKASEIFLHEDTLLELKAPLNICGDIHGQYSDLLEIFDICGSVPRRQYLFLGDYVDRGTNSLETICLLLALKIKFPNRIYLLRGNHESESMNMKYGFYAECTRRMRTRAFWRFIKCFDTMPIAAVIDKSIFCVHGGLSPSLTNIQEIQSIQRPINIEDSNIITDLLWSDPSEYKQGYCKSKRGKGVTFGSNEINTFLEINNLKHIVRAHETMKLGYKYFADGKLLSIFSAKNYGQHGGNDAAILKISRDLSFEIDVFVINRETVWATIQRHVRLYDVYEVGFV
ncbi:hypothetical protein GJ496_011522 [Pomphorhynchus laevis]|nr:hypothetical protein GJ496_011522 [Pomphorhynchus laevis]